jgi:hypothetical protein
MAMGHVPRYFDPSMNFRTATLKPPQVEAGAVVIVGDANFIATLPDSSGFDLQGEASLGRTFPTPTWPTVCNCQRDEPDDS